MMIRKVKHKDEHEKKKKKHKNKTNKKKKKKTKAKAKAKRKKKNNNKKKKMMTMKMKMMMMMMMMKKMKRMMMMMMMISSSPITDCHRNRRTCQLPAVMFIHVYRRIHLNMCQVMCCIFLGRPNSRPCPCHFCLDRYPAISHSLVFKHKVGNG